MTKKILFGLLITFITSILFASQTLGVKSNLSPASNSVLTENSVTISWELPGDYHYINIGTTQGGTDIHESVNYFTGSAFTVSNLPNSGTVYVRIFYYDWSYGSWESEDYRYSMSVGGPISPASGSTLSSTNVTFKWEIPGSYFWIDIGRSVGGDEIFTSTQHIQSQSYTVNGLPTSGTIYFRLWYYEGGMWKSNDYSYVMDAGSGGGNTENKTLIITSVNDDLDPGDKTIFADALRGYGYKLSLQDNNVSSYELKDYLLRTVEILYHTGHGSPGYISTSDGGLTTNYINRVSVENLIIATCLTLSDSAWRDKFVSTTKNIMGYTNLSYDFTDETVARDLAYRIGTGTSYPQAWYEVNNKQSSLYDRWKIYTKEGDRIVEYSAVSNNIPKALDDSQFTPLASGKVLVSKHIGGLAKTSQAFAKEHYDVREGIVNSAVSTEITSLDVTSLNESEAIVRAKKWVANRPEFKGAVLDRVSSVLEDQQVIGYQVRFKRVLNSLPVRGNRVNDYITILVDDASIAATDYHWSELTKQVSKTTISLLTPREAIERSADSLALVYKGDVLKIVGVEPCLGYKVNDTTMTAALVAAYELKSAEGLSVVVDAVTGEIL